MIKILLMILSINIFPNEFSIKQVNICGDGAEWPPYLYYKRDNEKKITTEIEGYTLDLLNKISELSNLKIIVKLIPWKRCLKEVQKNGLYSIALDSSYSEDRAKNFLYTKSYYKITPKLFYYEKAFPDGFPKFKNKNELLKIGTICGLQGYNYVGFLKGLKNSDLDLGAKNYDAVSKKTKLGRCTAFLARKEIFNGFKKIGKDYKIGKVFKEITLKNSKKEEFHMLISKKSPNADKLKLIIDQGIKRLQKTGVLNQLFKRYQ